MARKHERLSHYSDLGPAWFEIEDRDAEISIRKAVAYQKVPKDIIEARLLKGEEIECSATDWESVPDMIRDMEAAKRLVKASEAAQAAIPMVKCSCGHTIPKSQVMSASRGTSCPDCYDRMSNFD